MGDPAEIKARQIHRLLQEHAEVCFGGDRKVRQTSIDVYNEIRASGVLNEWQTNVWQCLYENGPMTQGELWDIYFPERQRHDICPRFAELKKMGAIEEVGKRKCAVTDRLCLVWATTNRIPSKTPVVKVLTKEQMQNRIDELETENRKLKNRIRNLTEALAESI